MPFKVNMRSGVAAAGDWTNLLRTDTTPVALDGSWSVNYVTGALPANDASSLGGWPTGGGAAWVDDENAATSGHRVPASPTWVQLKVTGPASQAFDLKAYSNGPSGRNVEWRVNGGTSQILDEGVANSVATFSATTDGAGEALIEYREGAGSSGTGYANAIEITPTAGASQSIGTVDTDDAVSQYQQSVAIPLTNFTETITSVTLSGAACPIQSQVVGTSVTVDFPGSLATGSYTLSVSGATESATKSISYTRIAPYTSPVGDVDSNSAFSSPTKITPGTYHWIESGPSNGTLDAVRAESEGLWANDIADIYTPDAGYTGPDTIVFGLLFDDGTTGTITATITVETPVDTTPDQFDLGADVVDAEPGATTQRTFVLAGIDPGETVSPSAIGSATVSPSTAQVGDTITVSLLAGTYEAVVTGGVTINGISDSLSVTTRAAVLPVQDIVLPDLSLGETDAVSIDFDNYFSGATSYSVSGIPANSVLSFAGSVLSGNVDRDDIAASPFNLTVTAFSAEGNIQDVFSVTVVDDIKPVITPNGQNPVTIVVGGTYIDQGATATDSVDGSLGQVVGVGSVDTNTVGQYTITYPGAGVVDTAGNVAEDATRTVNVVAEDPWPFSKGIRHAATTNWTWGKRHPKTGMRTRVYK